MFIKYWELYTTSSNENRYIRKMYPQQVHDSAGECFPVAWLITCKIIYFFALKSSPRFYRIEMWGF